MFGSPNNDATQWQHHFATCFVFLFLASCNIFQGFLAHAVKVTSLLHHFSKQTSKFAIALNCKRVSQKYNLH